MEFLSLSGIVVSAVLLGVVQADVFPFFPAGDTQTAGQTCHIAWSGDDTGSTTAWKDMTIELMTGDNFNMVHLTTVATGQDGTVNGTFDYTCPQVTPNAPIYFYQFRSPHTPDFEWTTRFPIASSSGNITPAPNSTEPDGANIPWGIGQLDDPSTAVPPPVFTTTTTTTATSTVATPTITATPTNVAPGIVAGCTGFFTETNLLCFQIVQEYGIALADFESWNGGSNVCNVLQPGLAYCVSHTAPPTVTTTTTTTTSPTSVPTPTNVASGVTSGCTRFFTETSLLCFEIAQQFGITVDNFEAWNGGASVCNILQTGLAYCVAAQPSNAAPGVIPGCRQFFTETDSLCFQIAQQEGITVEDFESWNGGTGVCNVLQSGLAYCISGPAP